MAEMNPQRLIFKEAYCNPESDTFGNAYKSALKAGFSDEYAKCITSQGTEWFSEIIRDMKMANKAEEVLSEMLEMPVKQKKIDNGEEVLLTDTALVKIKQDTAKFVASRLRKEKWSQRSELSGPGGSILMPLSEQTKKQINEAIDDYFQKIDNKGNTE